MPTRHTLRFRRPPPLKARRREARLPCAAHLLGGAGGLELLRLATHSTKLRRNAHAGNGFEVVVSRAAEWLKPQNWVNQSVVLHFVCPVTRTAVAASGGREAIE